MFGGQNSQRRINGRGLRSALALVLLLSALLWPMAVGAAPTSASSAEPTSASSAEPDAPSDADGSSERLDRARRGLAADFIPNDALPPPDADLVALSLENSSGEPGLAGATSGLPGYYQTSDYMIGHVAVGLVLPESDGGQEAQSEDWTDEEIEQVRAEVQDGLAWWASLEPSAHLTFTVETHLRVPTGYEPITHKLGEERLWIGETMTALGFGSGNYFSAVRDYANDLRDRVGSDWAFVIFVADSSADADGRFADNYFAYAYIGGPFTVMTYDNSGYRIRNMDAVLAHEMGHIFRALDQYAAAGVRCDYRAGYLSVKNGNSLAGGDCESDVPSIMRGGIFPYLNRSIDHFARGQIGWWDSDGDGVLDPVDAEPRVAAELEAVDGENDDLFSFSGQAWQEPVPSPVLADVTISYITAVGALVDGMTWMAATPEDGHFDTLGETFRLQVGPLAPGLHTLEIQAVNSERLASTSYVTTTFVYDPVDGALNCSLLSGPAEDVGSAAIQFGGVATAAYGDIGPDAPTVSTVQFRVDDGEWQEAGAKDGQYDSPIEGFSISLTDLPDGQHSLTVRATNSNGQIETNVEERSFQVETTFTVFIPIVQR
jgi:hypothetical protein